MLHLGHGRQLERNGESIRLVVDLLGPDKSYLGQTYDHDDPHIVCPWHGWEYKLLTGECAPDPSLRLKRFEVVQREGGIYVVV